jgi:hypothetical protein
LSNGVWIAGGAYRTPHRRCSGLRAFLTLLCTEEQTVGTAPLFARQITVECSDSILKYLDLSILSSDYIQYPKAVMQKSGLSAVREGLPVASR